MELFLLWLVMAVITAMIASSRDLSSKSLPNPLNWFIYGLLIWPIAIVHALVSKGGRVPCRYCAEYINKKATICPFCRKKVDGVEVDKVKDDPPDPHETGAF